jgi:hypothetical protein
MLPPMPPLPVRHVVRRGRELDVLRVAAFCGIWLAVFVWGIPIGGVLLARQTYALTSDGVYALVQTAAQVHTLWQVGLRADVADAHATAMRATLSTHLPQRVAADTTSYYWVGSYLADGSFIQAGYYVLAYAPDTAGWFYCAFSRAGAEGPCVYGPLESVLAGSHTYALVATTGPDGTAIWSASLDGRGIGHFPWSVGDTGSASPAVYMESSAVHPHAAESVLGPMTVSGFAIRPAGAASYRPVRAVYPAYSAADVCPPYGIRALGGGKAALGSGLGCPSPAVALR